MRQTIFRHIPSFTFPLILVCVVALASNAQTPDPSTIKTAAQTVAGLTAQELLALVALGCLALSWYSVFSDRKDIRNLVAMLSQRPCIREPEND